MDGKNIDSLKVKMYDLAIKQEQLKAKAEQEIQAIQQEMAKIKTTIETLTEHGTKE